MNNTPDSNEVKPTSAKRRQVRINSACQRCRKRKMRCSGIVEDGKCQGCLKALHNCMFLPKLSKLSTAGKHVSSPVIEHPFRYPEYSPSSISPQSSFADLSFNPSSSFSPLSGGGSTSLPSSSITTPTLTREWKWIEQDRNAKKARWIEYKGKEPWYNALSSSTPNIHEACHYPSPCTETQSNNLWMFDEMPYAHWPDPANAENPEASCAFPIAWESYPTPKPHWPNDMPLTPILTAAENTNFLYQQQQDHSLFEF
ncbi:Glucose transport transcription regulator RGT1 [Neolecta irregularis DAH-3]|uniref:Glucose transport transcription regulator RGT1 n=1 Tax=Neolecta irregularis (strain DAH-3) TaxID=1198029 RepID=A0A1U7LSW7_NEOID|nr:Glucose transport transcription regulator RGT1 [Neolecta irregularis DAH-3]|eukprot:OLL25611.1 Glucose transport transcription regulator RGT1 [Neolecta irregularis DAH-3]